MGTRRFASSLFLRWICLVSCFVVVQCRPDESDYYNLRSEVLNRSALIHRLPPNLIVESDRQADLHIDLFVMDIISIDEVDQVFTCNVIMSVNWTIPALHWNPDHYGGLDTLVIESSSVWLPRLGISSGDKDSMYLNMAETLILYSNGTLLSANHDYLSIRCPIDFRRYPFDQQSCSFVLMSLNVPAPSIELKQMVMQDKNMSEPFGEWRLVDSTTVSLWLSAFEAPRVTFNVRRTPVYYVIVLIFPMVLTSLLMPLVFLIPAKAGEMMSYLVAILTSTAIFITLISDVMPRGLSSTPYLAMLLIEIMAEGLCAILASLLVVKRHEQEQDTNKAVERNVVKTHTRVGQDEVCGQQVTSHQIKTFHSPPVCKSRNIASCQLDRIFLLAFVLGQSVFLIALFGFTDWLSNV